MKVKQPFETANLSLAFGQLLASIDSTVVLARRLVAGAPLVLLDASIAGDETVVVELGGGADGERYLVTVRATGASGDLLEREAELAVIDFTGAVPAAASPYLSAQAFVDRLGLDEAVALTAVEVSAASPRIDTARLQSALDDAQAEVDGYLAGRYATPLSAVPALVTTIVFDLAVARLWRAELPEGVKDRRDRAQAQLRDLAKGVLTLAGAAGLDPAALAPAPVLIETTERLFTRKTLRGF